MTFEDLLAHPAVAMLFVFVARVLDVSLGTLRTILVFRGRRAFAALVGFFEVLIWILAASRALQDVGAPHLAMGYAGGFAAGNYLGMWIESRLAMGSELIRIVSQNPERVLSAHLRGLGYSFVEVLGRGDDAPVEILLVVLRRKKVPELLRAVDAFDPSAYYTVSDVKDHAAQLGRIRRAHRQTSILKRK